VRLAGSAFAGVEIVLVTAPESMVDNPQASLALLSSRYRATSGSDGRYRINEVPPGTSGIAVIYPLRPGGGSPVVVAGSAAPGGRATSPFPARVTVADKPVTLPELRFQPAVPTRTFGELQPSGHAVRLHWDAWPGAAAYRVEVLAPPDMAYLFNQRVSREKLYEFRAHPVLWQVPRTTALRAECPLLSLAPDNPSNVRFTTYDYAITALDGSGQPLAVSAPPLCRFLLSDAARGALLALHPPVRSRRRFRPLRRRPRPPADGRVSP